MFRRHVKTRCGPRRGGAAGVKHLDEMTTAAGAPEAMTESTRGETGGSSGQSKPALVPSRSIEPSAEFAGDAALGPSRAHIDGVAAQCRRSACARRPRKRSADPALRRRMATTTAWLQPPPPPPPPPPHSASASVVYQRRVREARRVLRPDFVGRPLRPPPPDRSRSGCRSEGARNEELARDGGDGVAIAPGATLEVAVMSRITSSSMLAYVAAREPSTGSPPSAARRS